MKSNFSLKKIKEVKGGNMKFRSGSEGVIKFLRGLVVSRLGNDHS